MRIFKDDLNRMVVTVANVTSLLNKLETQMTSYFDTFNHKEELFSCAYIIRVGVLNRIAKNNWSLTLPVYIPQGLFRTYKTNLIGALDMTVDRLKRMVEEDALVSDYVEGILERNKFFYDFDEQISPFINKENI